jgi:hypothetical protein
MEPLSGRAVETRNFDRDPTVRALSSERLAANASDRLPLAGDTAEQPPMIGRAEIVAFALVALLVISVAAVLYFAKAFFLPS